MLWSQVVKTANYQEDALSVPLLFTRISCFAALDRAACPDFLYAGLRDGRVCGFH
jgi:hypothetical protein